jgi:hypothetical protein
VLSRIVALSLRLLSTAAIIFAAVESNAATLTCVDLFSPKEQSIAGKIFSPRYDVTKVRDTKETFLSELRAGRFPDPTTLKTPEEKIALIDAIAANNSADIFDLANWLENTSASQRRQLRSALRKFKFEEKTGWSKSEKALVKLYLLTHINPRNSGLVAVMRGSQWSVPRFLELIKSDWGTEVAELERHRAGLSLARRGVLKTFEELGLIRSQNSLDRARLALRAYSAPLDIIGSTIKSAISFYFPLITTRTPKILLRAKDLSDETHQRFVNEGFNSIRDEVHKLYGRSAKVQAVLNRTERTLGALMMPIMIGMLIYDFDDIKGMIKSWITDEEVELDQKEHQTKLFTNAEREAMIKQIYQAEREMRIRNIVPEEENIPEDEKKFRIEGIDQQLKDENFEAYLHAQSDPALKRIVGP